MIEIATATPKRATPVSAPTAPATPKRATPVSGQARPPVADPPDDEIAERPRSRKKNRPGDGGKSATEDWENSAFAKWFRVVGCAFGALFLIIATVKLYSDLSALDAGTQESVQVWKPAALAYKWGGKWPAVGVMSLLTLVGIAGVPILAYDALSSEKSKPAPKKRRRRD